MRCRLRSVRVNQEWLATGTSATSREGDGVSCEDRLPFRLI